MNYLHYELDAGPQDVVEVSLDNAANVQLMDTANYTNYRAGQQYRYTGGYAKSSPCRLSPPRRGNWHLVVDLGGYPGRVNASVRVLRVASA